METLEKLNSVLKNKKIILFGGSSGIGLATAKLAAAEGAKVVVVSGNQNRINNALKELPEGSEGFAVDLSKEENIEQFFETIGNFDHLVYSAGENLVLNTIDQTNIDEARSFWNVRYWGAFAAVKYGATHINAGGAISLISGTAGARPGVGWSVGTSICAAMEGFVRAMAVELAPIRVNAVVPGFIDTNLWGGINEADRKVMFDQHAEKLPLKRIGEAEDVALAFVYLMKQQFGTGQNITVDGGAVLV